VRRAATDALSALRKLKLEHTTAQDIETTPFNWPAVQSLQMGFAVRGTKQVTVGGDAAPAADYPTDVIRALADLRDAADEALLLEKPKRGNAPRRTAKQALIDAAGKAFVKHYQDAFGECPKISETGPAVVALEEFIEALGLFNLDAAALLRRSVAKQKESIQARGDGSD
jgi:hypothetical protein